MTNQTPAAGGDLVERVARAIGHVKITSPKVSATASIRDLLIGISAMAGRPWDEESFDDSMRQMARAAIEAMRSPIAAMVEAGVPMMSSGALDPMGSAQELIQAYRAMIDAALQEPKP